MANALPIRQLLTLDTPAIDGLSSLLIDCVEGGASVGFMWPMTHARAVTYWQDIAARVAQNERLLLVAEDSSGIVGTVSVILAQPDNQPHRGDLVKMLVHRRARRQGLGAALLTSAEQLARTAGKTLLVLDTASDEAERLYSRQGWQRCGQIPHYALWPDGTPCATVFYFKLLEGEALHEISQPYPLADSHLCRKGELS